MSDLTMERLRAPATTPRIQLAGEPLAAGGYFFTLCLDGEWFSYVSVEDSLSEALAELAVEIESIISRSAPAND